MGYTEIDQLCVLVYVDTRSQLRELAEMHRINHRAAVRMGVRMLYVAMRRDPLVLNKIEEAIYDSD